MPDYSLDAAAGSTALTGHDVGLLGGFLLGCGAGSFALTGGDHDVHRGLDIAAWAGSYAWAGQSIALPLARRIAPLFHK